MNFPEEDMYGLEVHPHVVGGIIQVTDNEGNKRIISSASASKVIQNDIPPEYRTQMEEIIETIDYKTASLGFSSSKFIGVDELDNKSYPEEKLICGDVKFSGMKGLYRPYNNIIYHSNNQWKYDCLEMNFLIENGIIPYNYCNIPYVLNIPRSNGDIQKGILSKNEGLLVRKSISNGDLTERIYVPVWFSIVDPDDIVEENCKYTKAIPIELLLQHNKNIKNINIKIPQFNKEEIEIVSQNTTPEIKSDAMEYYNKKFRNWSETILETSIPEMENVKITIS